MTIGRSVERLGEKLEERTHLLADAIGATTAAAVAVVVLDLSAEVWIPLYVVGLLLLGGPLAAARHRLWTGVREAEDEVVHRPAHRWAYRIGGLVLAGGAALTAATVTSWDTRLLWHIVFWGGWLEYRSHRLETRVTRDGLYHRNLAHDVYLGWGAVEAVEITEDVYLRGSPQVINLRTDTGDLVRIGRVEGREDILAALQGHVGLTSGSLPERGAGSYAPD